MRALRGVRVCMVTSAHPADDDRIFFKEARSLVKAGAHVVVLCAQGKVPPERTDGVEFTNHSGDGGLTQRVLSVRRLEQAIAELHCDVIHCHEPDSLAASLRVKRRLGTKVIFDSHEMWGGVVAGRFPRFLWRPVEAAYRFFESKYLCQCDAAIGASLAISRYLSNHLGHQRVATVLNVPVVELFGEGAARKWDDTTFLCHDGHLTFDRGLKTMAEAIRMISTQHPVVFKIVGDLFGDEEAWLDGFIRKHRMDDTIVKTGWLPYGEVGQAIAPCQIGLVCLLPSPNNRIAAPNKCFNYLLYGLAVLGPDYPLSHFSILKREGCAVLADPTSADAYAEALSGMICRRIETEKMATRARHLSKTKYRWKHMEPVLLDLYQRVLGRQG